MVPTSHRCALVGCLTIHSSRPPDVGLAHPELASRRRLNSSVRCRMSLAVADTFRISCRSGFVVVTSAILLTIVIASWPPPMAALPSFLAAFSVLALTVLVPVVSVRDDGIRLYIVNKLQWSDIAAAENTSVLGLPYIAVSRKSGMRWWIPLYVGDRHGLLTSLASRAPAGNPIQILVTASN